MPSILSRVSSRSTVSKDHKCTVQMLDDTQTITVDFKKNDPGQTVLDYVCDMLNIVEKDYFGLRYVDTSRQRYWLDTIKPVLRQVKGASMVFAFRVKYYPSDPTIIKEELTRYLLALQLKRDLLHGRLYCPQTEAAVLGALILQADIGDYDPIEYSDNYVSQFKLFLNQTPKLEEKIALEHQKLKGKGLSPAEADLQFLKKACLLDTYGYYPYTIKDPKAGQVYMGATPHGVLVYQTHRKLHHIKWDDVKDFDYAGKDFYVYPAPEYFEENNIEDDDEEENRVQPTHENRNGTAPLDHDFHGNGNASRIVSGSKKKSSLRFICPSSTFCKHLWKYMLAEQAFFTKHRAAEIKPVAKRRGPLFRRTTFRYTGRVMQEIKEAPSPRRAEPSFDRSHLQRQMPRDERSAPWANKFHTLPRTTKSEGSDKQAAATISKEAPDHIVARNNLAVDTTAHATPTVSPLFGISPISANGLQTSDFNGTSRIVDDSIFDATRVATSSMSTTNGGGYKQDSVTVSFKHVEPIGSEEFVGRLSKNVDLETQRPLGTSTPIKSASQKPEVRSDQLTRESKEKAANEKISSPTSTAEIVRSAEGPRTPAVTTAIPQPSRAGRFGRALVKLVLSGLMFTILLIGSIIVIMEVQDPQFRQYLRNVPGEDTFRHDYYEPSRQQALEWFDHAFGKRVED